jgi:hypothetical protein
VPGWVTAGAFMVVMGFVLNRINTSGIATVSATGSSYVPSWMEVSVTLGIVSSAVLVFLFFVERLRVYGEPRATGEPDLPVPDPVTQVRLSGPWSGDGRRYSLAFVIGAALAFAFLPPSALEGARPAQTPTRQARITEALKAPGPHGFAALTLTSANPDGDRAEIQEVEALLIDGNRDGRYVLFDHRAHEGRLGEEESCRQCHHANAPLARASPCAGCHTDMYEPSDTFDHTAHVDWTGGNGGCSQCHQDSAAPRTRQTATNCLSCHQRMLVVDSRVEVAPERFTGVAPGYMDAMHGLCVDCHQEPQPERAELQPHLGRCAACHGSVEEEHLQMLAPQPHIVTSQQTVGTASQSRVERWPSTSRP